MKTITFTEFRQNATAYLNAVEDGEILRIFRHGKPVADVVPIVNQKKVPSWKRSVRPLNLKGISLSEEILKERREYKR